MKWLRISDKYRLNSNEFSKKFSRNCRTVSKSFDFWTVTWNEVITGTLPPYPFALHLILHPLRSIRSCIPFLLRHQKEILRPSHWHRSSDSKLVRFEEKRIKITWYSVETFWQMRTAWSKSTAVGIFEGKQRLLKLKRNINNGEDQRKKKDDSYSSTP